MFAVAVTFFIAPERVADFRALMIAQAKNSLALEPGCRHFDVWTDPKQPSRFFLYELYDDAAAFEVHLASEHFKTFAAAIEPMVAHREILTFADAPILTPK